MELQPYVDEVREQLLHVAAANGPESSRIAEQMSANIDAVVRLVLLDAISGAADEITLELAPSSVAVQLRGRDPEFVVDHAQGADFPLDRYSSSAHSVVADGAADEGGTARITLRLSEALKLRVEAAAEREVSSVNSWIVRTLASATDSRDNPRPAFPTSGRTFTGWVQ